VVDEDFQKMVREKLLGVMANNGNKQKVVLERCAPAPGKRTSTHCLAAGDKTFITTTTTLTSVGIRNKIPTFLLNSRGQARSGRTDYGGSWRHGIHVGRRFGEDQDEGRGPSSSTLSAQWTSTRSGPARSSQSTTTTWSRSRKVAVTQSTSSVP